MQQKLWGVEKYVPRTILFLKIVLLEKNFLFWFLPLNQYLYSYFDKVYYWTVKTVKWVFNQKPSFSFSVHRAFGGPKLQHMIKFFDQIEFSKKIAYVCMWLDFSISKKRWRFLKKHYVLHCMCIMLSEPTCNLDSDRDWLVTWHYPPRSLLRSGKRQKVVPHACSKNLI